MLPELQQITAWKMSPFNKIFLDVNCCPKEGEVQPLWSLFVEPSTPPRCDSLHLRLTCALNLICKRHFFGYTFFPWQTLLFLALALDAGFAGCELR